MDTEEKRTQVRLPGGVYKWLSDRAGRNNRSLNGEMITIFQAEQAKDRKKSEEQEQPKP